MNLHVIDTGFFKLDGGAMFGVVPKVMWEKLNEPDVNNLCTWAMRCLLVEDGDRLILIDTGIGDKQSEKFFSHFHPHGEASLIGSLAEKGFHPNDITDVLLTHLHFDHCGGAVMRNKNGDFVPTFPNAKYWSHKDHWEWARTPNPREKASFLAENFLPLEEREQIHFLTNGEELIPGLSVKTMYGHTEAMLIPHIKYKDNTVVFMADLLPSTAHLPLAYVMSYDIRPLDTMAERGKFLQEAHENNYVLFYEHDAVNQCSRTIETRKGIRASETFRLSDL
ncbi:MBL fold metallo-hydrolase [Chitinophagales bacterium]|nr:MBL fold metallo-hydrolase [Chitinophagales bacterium]